jgi:hypothetical protein
MRERHFTWEEASALLPWLEETFARLAPLREELAERHTSLLELLRQRSSNGAASKDQEIRSQQTRIESINEQLRQGIQEVTDRGIIVRDLGQGLVDFPSERDGREIFLCWISGEDRIGYWHGTNEGFASRKPL